MTKIKTVVLRYMCVIAALMVVVLITFAVLIQVNREQNYTRVSTASIFDQVEHLLKENASELEETIARYSDECLKNAETIAYIIESDPSVLDSLDELRHIAEITNVDEIHLFNDKGVIFNGTHPEYYNMSVDDGDQIGFFKRMLFDRSLKLVQKLTPNTGKGFMIQYSAVWSRSGKFFVQVGMKQENVRKVTEKNELSYIFSLLRVNSSVKLYAVDKESGRISGSTTLENTGKTLDDIGIPLEKALSSPSGFHQWVNGQLYFCMFEQRGDIYLGRVVTFDGMYRSVISMTAILAAGIVMTALILVIAVTRFTDKEIIKGIENINGKLSEISAGNLDARVDLRSCAEFSELSDHINGMIASVLSGTDKISYVLNRAELPIGVYEYNENMKTVRFTEKLTRILSLDDQEIGELTADCALFKEYLRARVFDKVSDEENIYRLARDGERDDEKYVRFEEFIVHNSILGIIMDVTEEYLRRRRLEAERDIDGLTGLLNRRGLDRRLEELFKEPEKLGCGALVMIDADGLKQINDKFGHEAGDIYLKSIAEVLRAFADKNSVGSRQGGDEFVLFLYGYESDDRVEEQLHRLADIREERAVKLTESETANIKFSFGAAFLDGSGEYTALLKTADDRMYENKRQRKAAASKSAL